MVESPLRQRRAHSLTRVCNAGRGGIFKRGWPLRMTGIRWPSTQRTKFVGVPSYPRSSISYLKREVFTRRVCYRRLPTSASACLPTSSIFLSKPSLWNKTNSRDPFSELTRCVLQLERREALYHPCLQCKPSLQFPNPKQTRLMVYRSDVTKSRFTQKQLYVKMSNWKATSQSVQVCISFPLPVDSTDLYYVQRNYCTSKSHYICHVWSNRHWFRMYHWRKCSRYQQVSTFLLYRHKRSEYIDDHAQEKGSHENRRW